jgi:hypothetical protein
MLKNKEIGLVNVRDASRLQAYLGELQANVTVYEWLDANTAFSANIAEKVDFVMIEIIAWKLPGFLPKIGRWPK